MAYVRGQSWDLLCWFFQIYELFRMETGEAIDGFSEVAVWYLAYQVSAVVEWKLKSLKSHSMQNGAHTVKAIEKQIELCFLKFPDIPNITTAALDTPLSLAFPNPERCG